MTNSYLHFNTNKLYIFTIVVVSLLSCNTGDPIDPTNPTDPNNPTTGYHFTCPEGIDLDCPILGLYFEVNPYFHPNTFPTWVINRESIGNPYYIGSISQISPQCDKIILRGSTGQVQREIPIILLNDSMLILRDELIRSENIILTRAKGYKNYFCDSICVLGCHNDMPHNICRCEEFYHGWKCSQNSFLYDFTIDDYVLDVIINNNTIFILSGEKLSDGAIKNVQFSSISENGALNWTKSIYINRAKNYFGYSFVNNTFNFIFTAQPTHQDSQSLIRLTYNTISESTQETVLYENLNWTYMTTVSTPGRMYIIGRILSQSIFKIQILKIDDNQVIAFENTLELPSTDPFIRGIGSYNSQTNELLYVQDYAPGKDVFVFDGNTLNLISTYTHNSAVSTRIISNNPYENEFYNNSPYSVVSSPFQNRPDNVIVYSIIAISDYKFQHTNILWSPGSVIGNTVDLFKDNQGNYLFFDTPGSTLRFGKYENNMYQFEYIYTYPYAKPLHNIHPRQISSGNYIFVCNTYRFGSNRDVLIIKFNEESGLYKYPHCP